MSGTDATRCKVCGGPFAAKRILIDGEAYHERCSYMSHGSHTYEDYCRLSDKTAALVKALEEITAAFEGLRPLPLVLDAMAQGLISQAKAALGAVGASKDG